MHQTASNVIQRQLVVTFRALGAAVALGAATALLARAAWQVSQGTTGLDMRVAVAVLVLGVLAGTALTAGTALVAIASAARAAGHSARAVERAAARLTPRLLRRALVVGLGAGLTGFAGPALADTPPDLGWQVTEQTAEQIDDAVDEPPDTTPTATVTLTSVPATTATTEQPTSVVVEPGDCLWSIAAGHLPANATDAEIAAAWPAWYEANATTIGADPDQLLPGQHLVIPREAVS